MHTREYIKNRYQELVNIVKKRVKKWQEDDCYLLQFNPYTRDNWKIVYELCRNNRQLLIDISIIFNTELLLLQTPLELKKFYLGKILIEELFDAEELTCYHHTTTVRMAIGYHDNPEYLGRNYLRAEDSVHINCDDYNISDYMYDITTHESMAILDRSRTARVLFHYYCILKLSESMPKPKQQIKDALAEYFRTHVDFYTALGFDFTLMDDIFALTISPANIHYESYEGEHDEAVAAIGKKYNVELRFSPNIYHTST